MVIITNIGSIEKAQMRHLCPTITTENDLKMKIKTHHTIESAANELAKLYLNSRDRVFLTIGFTMSGDIVKDNILVEDKPVVIVHKGVTELDDWNLGEEWSEEDMECVIDFYIMLLKNKQRQEPTIEFNVQNHETTSSMLTDSQKQLVTEYIKATPLNNAELWSKQDSIELLESTVFQDEALLEAFKTIDIFLFQHLNEKIGNQWSCSISPIATIKAGTSARLYRIWSHTEHGMTDPRDIVITVPRDMTVAEVWQLLESEARKYVRSQGAEDIRYHYIDDVRTEEDGSVTFVWGT